MRFRESRTIVPIVPGTFVGQWSPLSKARMIFAKHRGGQLGQLSYSGLACGDGAGGQAFLNLTNRLT